MEAGRAKRILGGVQLRKSTAITLMIAIFITAAALFAYREQRVIGEIHGAEFDRLTIGDSVYSLRNGLDYTSADKGSYLGKAAYGTSTLRLYTVNGDAEGKYIYALWDWEGFFYVRENSLP